MCAFTEHYKGLDSQLLHTDNISVAAAPTTDNDLLSQIQCSLAGSLESDFISSTSSQFESIFSTLPGGMSATRYLLFHALYRPIKVDTCIDTMPKILVIGKYCAEGDNVMDGMQLALIVLNGLSINDIVNSSYDSLDGARPSQQAALLTLSDLHQPKSWGGLYGADIYDKTMFY